MEMESLMLFLLASAGATIIVVLSSIFEPIRSLFYIDDDTIEAVNTKQIRKTVGYRLKFFFGNLIHCPLCFGFWMGVVMYFFIYGIENYNFFMHFAYACASSIASMLSYGIIKK
jgi:hypothetical protein